MQRPPFYPLLSAQIRGTKYIHMLCARYHFKGLDLVPDSSPNPRSSKDGKPSVSVPGSQDASRAAPRTKASSCWGSQSSSQTAGTTSLKSPPRNTWDGLRCRPGTQPCRPPLQQGPPLNNPIHTRPRFGFFPSVQRQSIRSQARRHEAFVQG